MAATAKFPLFDITYTLNRKRKGVKPLYTPLDKSAIHHQNALMQDILLSKETHGGLYQLKNI